MKSTTDDGNDHIGNDSNDDNGQGFIAVPHVAIDDYERDDQSCRSDTGFHSRRNPRVAVTL